MRQPVDLVVLAGGRAERMAGRDKTTVQIGGRAVLDRVIAAGPGRVLVVGPPRPTALEVTWLREEPPFGGPVAGIAVALPHVQSAVVAVLAGDLPFVTAPALDALAAALAADDEADGAVLVDDDGRAQQLCGVWRTAALRRAVGALDTVRDASVRRLLAPLRVLEVAIPTAGPPPWLDLDTPADVRRAQEAL